MYYKTSYGFLPEEYNTEHAMVNIQLFILLKDFFQAYKSQLKVCEYKPSNNHWFAHNK